MIEIPGPDTVIPVWHPLLGKRRLSCLVILLREQLLYRKKLDGLGSFINPSAYAAHVYITK
jgi:hypothetical protein